MRRGFAQNLRSSKRSRPPESGGQRDPTGSREGRFPEQTLEACGLGTPARAISTASQSRCPPDSGGRRCSFLRIATWLFCALTLCFDAAYAQNPPVCERAVLTLDEAAELLRVDTTDLARLAEKKKVPARRIGSSWRFSCVTLMEWLK